MMKKLVRIPLQFFGEGGDDFEDDFGYEDEEGYEDEDPAADDGQDDNDNGAGEEPPAKDSDKGDGTKALFDELRAMGYVGDDIASLTADIQAKRKSREKDSAVAERRAAMSEGKNHVKSGKPARGASGDGMDGFTERDLAEINACLKHKGDNSKQRARVALESVTRTSKK